MDQSGYQSKERISEQSGLETTARQEGAEKPSVLKEAGKKAKEILNAKGAEAAEGQEGVELSEGRVAEGAGEDKVYAPAAKGGGRARTADEIEAIRAKLLANLPSQPEMIRQITRRLVKQEKVLFKKQKKLQKEAARKAYALAMVVAQLRQLRAYFALLAHATFEMLKHLWLKIVHGV